MMEAVLSNADHPEYGVATIPLPIPRNQYDHCVALLEALEIGDASEADCRVDSLDSAWPVLNRLVSTKVNLDELDYLAKRLDSFTVGEFSQFQAMVEKLHLTSMKDLINLTFCCQQATVITDFTNLKEVGRDHYMNIHGGCASMEELEQLDGVETAVLLIEDNEGTITRYGVVYDNGMQLSQLYDGKHLPCYHYEADMTVVGISSRWEPENSRNVTWIYLPASKGQIERAMQRSGIADPKDMRLFMADSSFPEEVDVALDFRCDNIYELNELALVADKLSCDDRRKLGAAVSMAKPECASQIRRLAENLDLFEFAPGAHTPEEYGKYMIQRSGHFEYDPNLDEFYDYERYGLQHMGYVAETDHYRYCLRCTPTPGDYQGYLYCYDKRQQEMAQKDKIVGRVTFADGTAQEFTDPNQYLQTIKEELPLRNTTGFKHETLSEDPEIKKAVDDILLDFAGEENPRRTCNYGLTEKGLQALRDVADPSLPHSYAWFVMTDCNTPQEQLHRNLTLDEAVELYQNSDHPEKRLGVTKDDFATVDFVRMVDGEQTFFGDYQKLESFKNDPTIFEAVEQLHQELEDMSQDQGMTM
ncbi:antirestriction protein ArdA [Flavonifractor plautii]|uniref:antirestriction protein ArdA n=1 Tax=Flavonifractor plautii TaxID=292800 RepID=UPI001D01D970|nr:antirestriction protein ArdA [Flavonifractor plautii]MCB5779987.1 antirestriction protein ArdA [Flavonifractor plautii]